MRTWLVQKKLKHPGASTHPNVLNLSSGKYTKSHTIQVSKTIRAPLRFVYDWCTDYRESDPKITGSKSKRKILLKNKHRVVYVVNYRSRGRPKSAVDVITLYPPRAWHLDFTGDEDNEVGDYVLTSLGRRKTRLDMNFQEHYKISRAPTKAQDVKSTHEIWDKYVAALERDYAHKHTREKS
jgi:hypothetical protein